MIISSDFAPANNTVNTSLRRESLNSSIVQTTPLTSMPEMQLKERKRHHGSLAGHLFPSFDLSYSSVCLPWGSEDSYLMEDEHPQ